MIVYAGIQVESTIKAGGLVPDDMILRLISNELNKRGWLFTNKAQLMSLASSIPGSSPESSSPADADLAVDAFLSTNPPHLEADPSTSDDPAASFLLDGFPRTAAQADRLDEIVPVNFVVSLTTPLKVIIDRIAGRWVHEASGRVYNTAFNAPKVPGLDDVTGEPLTRREDDSEEVYRSRFEKFQKTNEPLLEHYAKKGVLWEVDGLSSDEISPKLYEEFEKRFVH